MISNPNWFDEDLHGAALSCLSNRWMTLSEIKPYLGAYADKAYEIMRDLSELQLVDIKMMPFIHYNNVASAKACYKIKEVNQ